MEKYSSIPVIDLERGLEEHQAIEMDHAMREFGFMAITNHGVPKQAFDEAFAVSQKFFDQSLEYKLRTKSTDPYQNVGYVAPNQETAVGHKKADLKEFYHVSRDLPAGHPYRQYFSENVWPEDMPEFREKLVHVYTLLDGVAKKVLRRIAIAIGEDEWFFDRMAGLGNSILRSLHYPALKEVPTDAVRAGAHGDINLITLLYGSNVPGLQLQTKQGEWMDVTTFPGALVVNTGDMLERVTNAYYKSTIHRVVNPEGDWIGKARLSLPFFAHPNPDAKVNPLPQFVTEEYPNLKYKEDLTAHEFLVQRLQALGLGKAA